jgi:hypothetical protein
MLVDVLSFHARESLTLTEAGYLFGDPPLLGGAAGKNGERLIVAAAGGDLETLDEFAYCGARVSRAQLARFIAVSGDRALRTTYAAAWARGEGMTGAPEQRTIENADAPERRTPQTATTSPVPAKSVVASKPAVRATAASKVAQPRSVTASSFDANAPELQPMYLFGGAVTIARAHRKGSNGANLQEA